MFGNHSRSSGILTYRVSSRFFFLAPYYPCCCFMELALPKCWGLLQLMASENSSKENHNRATQRMPTGCRTKLLHMAMGQEAKVSQDHRPCMVRPSMAGSYCCTSPSQSHILKGSLLLQIAGDRYSLEGMMVFILTNKNQGNLESSEVIS